MHRLAVALVLLTALRAVAQNPASDPQAVSLAQQSIAALTGGNPISDVTLNANVTATAASGNETGTGTLQAKGVGESRIDLTLPSGMRTEIRNDGGGTNPQGESAVNGGNYQLWAQHNCWISASWFFPALSVLASTSDPTVIFSYVGMEKRNGSSVQHIQSYRYIVDPSRSATTALTQRLSTTDFYLDASSLLPIAITFNTHPTDNDGMDLRAEIEFFKYQLVNGVLVPFRIQQTVFGSLILDVTVKGVALNSGISDSVFAIQ
jgi:hypothetical protein